MARPPSYGLIYNWDGAPHAFSEYPQSMEDFLEKSYAPMVDTQVGAHFWCLDAHNARWKSDALEMVGDVHGRKYESTHSLIHDENIRAMLDRGEDPQEGAIKRGHELGMHVYASIRMNDNHFNGAKPEDLPKMDSSRLTRMRIEHPEWLLGDQTMEWFALSWNFEVPEVREHKYALIEDACRRYDWDGVELDWQRHSYHLPDDHGYRLKYVLTDLQRAVRRMTNELGEKRGRPFYLAARVAPTLEACRRLGFDVPAWIEEDLVDILIPANMSDTDPSIDVRAFVELCHGTGVAVYPGVDTEVRLPGFNAGINAARIGPEDAYTKDQMVNRGIASRFHKDGADGIYIFNWYSDGNTRHELMNQIGSPDTLRGKDKIYHATHRYLTKAGSGMLWYGAFHNDRVWGEVPVRLKRTLTGDGPTATLDVADDLAQDPPKRIELRVRLESWLKGDVVRLIWDGTERGNVEARYHPEHDNYANPFASPVSDVSDSVWLTSQMDPADVSQGRHRVKVVLAERNPRMLPDIVLTHVELAITYGEG